ncbi:MAG TPA: hypothetical protein VEJ63_22460 [Planctomycetota bacterium]|nr:hypothetical protein [Planctomycetota bacterium]
MTYRSYLYSLAACVIALACRVPGDSIFRFRSTLAPNRTIHEASTERVLVEEVYFRGWYGAVRISNSVCEVVIVPQISRVMSFSLRGGENVLWINPALEGKVAPRDDGRWHNFGGDKVWPAMQSLWGWPPPYHFDSGMNSVEWIPGGVRLRTPESLRFGAYLEREFVLDSDAALLRVNQWLVRTRPAPMRLTVWNVTQTDDPDYTLLPRGSDEAFQTLSGKAAAPFVTIHESIVCVRRHRQDGLKIGALAASKDDSWIAAVKGRTMLLESHAVISDADYPDGGCHAEIFTSPDSLGPYVEIELLSPMSDVQVGEYLSSPQVWQLLELSEEEARDPERAGAAARAAHERVMGEDRTLGIVAE